MGPQSAMLDLLSLRNRGETKAPWKWCASSITKFASIFHRTTSKSICKTTPVFYIGSPWIHMLLFLHDVFPPAVWLEILGASQPFCVVCISGSLLKLVPSGDLFTWNTSIKTKVFQSSMQRSKQSWDSCMRFLKSLSGWWLNQTHLDNMLVKMGI